MRAGVVDNSTLTACQRLLGDIKVANLHNIDGDIAALETLLQAILFCDKLFYLDDYKPEYKLGRTVRFPFITPLDLTPTKRTELINSADSITKDLIIKVEAGEITTSAVRDFLEQMNMHFLFAWPWRAATFC